MYYLWRPDQKGSARTVMLKSSYYQSNDVVFLAKDLIGKTLCTHIGNHLTCGISTETEAYAGIVDRASHAYGDRRTARTETMYSKGGVSYVYLCYGIHHLFNIVTSKAGEPHAVLVRAIWPTVGIEKILARRSAGKLTKTLCNGPGKVTQALGIDLLHNNVSLTGKQIWISDEGVKIDPADIRTGPRIGVDYAGADAALPYRFWTDNYNFKNGISSDRIK